jgi:hypothetical protein
MWYNESEFVRVYIKKLDNKIEDLERFITEGPSSDINSDEVAMEYLKRLGQLSAYRETKIIFEELLRAYESK